MFRLSTVSFLRKAAATAATVATPRTVTGVVSTIRLPLAGTVLHSHFFSTESSFIEVPPPPTSNHKHTPLPGAKNSLIYTETDEAPALATYSLYPVIKKVWKTSDYCLTLKTLQRMNESLTSESSRSSSTSFFVFSIVCSFRRLRTSMSSPVTLVSLVVFWVPFRKSSLRNSAFRIILPI